MKQTDNLKLNLYEESDRFALEAYNENFENLDLEMSGISKNISVLQTKTADKFLMKKYETPTGEYMHTIRQSYEGIKAQDKIYFRLLDNGQTNQHIKVYLVYRKDNMNYFHDLLELTADEVGKLYCIEIPEPSEITGDESQLYNSVCIISRADKAGYSCEYYYKTADESYIFDSMYNSNNMSFRVCTADQYKAMTHQENTLYLVKNGSEADVYLGDIKLSGGGSAPVSISAYAGKTLAGKVTTITQEET